MDVTGLKQRLTAILAADAVGYSRLMSTDDRAITWTPREHTAVKISHEHGNWTGVDLHYGRRLLPVSSVFAKAS